MEVFKLNEVVYIVNACKHILSSNLNTSSTTRYLRIEVLYVDFSLGQKFFMLLEILYFEKKSSDIEVHIPVPLLVVKPKKVMK